MPAIVLWLVVIAGCWYFYRRYREEVNQRLATREHFYDDCKSLFEDIRIVQKLPTDYPQLYGQYCGVDFHLNPLIESLGVRKLPTMWLICTLQKKTGLSTTVCAMMRPANIEFFSPFDKLQHYLDTRPDWPAHAIVRSDQPQPPVALLDDYTDLLAGRGKELMISPARVRTVQLLDEGGRGEFLLFRQAKFDIEQLPVDTVQPLLDRLLALHSDVTEWTTQDANAKRARNTATSAVTSGDLSK